jgi:microsomal dipeptidase-like Zn-dependent dipeptidase
MRGSRIRILLALCALLLACLPAAASAQGAHVPSADDRYSLAHGCFNTSGALTAQAIRMQATDLGRYLLYTKDRKFVTGTAPGSEASSPSESAEWDVTGDGPTFTLKNLESGQTATATFAPAEGCADYPEADVNAVGTPGGGATPYGEARGFVDGHLHLMAFEFIGGSIRCGRPWHKYGVTHAMVDCPDHEPNGLGAPGGQAEGILSHGNPVSPHDTKGWPTFNDWPAYDSFTHEGIYWKGLERAWRGGLRLFVNLLVDNSALCDIYPLKRNPCHEMNTVRIEMQRTRELERYIDAQNGGPGKGWFRVVRDPSQARRTINQGKLAVVLGLEVSQPFDCRIYNDQPQCDKKVITDWLNELDSAGVRQMELTNKFDNALVGVAGDSGSQGAVTTVGNKKETGNFFDFRDCEDEYSDRVPLTQSPDHNTDALLSLFETYLPPGQVPVYGSGPQCNKRGLSDLGDFTIRDLARRGILVDPDHMSVLGRRQSLSVTESLDYSGVVSSHSWSTDDAYPRIYKAGGFNAPYAGASTSFVRQWQKLRKMRTTKFRFGVGYGADMNGFGTQGAPRGADAQNKVEYPFRSFDGKVLLDKQVWGERVWDVNTDGTAQYGLYADWVEDLRKLAGQQIVDDLAMGVEAYLQTWERATKIRGPGCRSAHEGFAKAGNELGRIKLGNSPEGVLRSSNQPVTRNGRVFKWCVGDKGDRKGEISAVFSPKERVGLVASTAPKHRFDRIGRGSPATRLHRSATKIASTLYVRRVAGGNRIVYGTKRGKVTFVALATATIGTNRAELLRYLKLAGVR